MSKKKRIDIIKLIGIIVFVIVGVVSWLSAEGYIFHDDTKQTISVANSYIDFIDCGQGDSTLIVSDGKVMLVDASTGEAGVSIVEHLNKRGIERIDHLVLTHPHEDHIGGAIDILSSFKIGKIYMKQPTLNTEPTTKVYIDLLRKIRELDLKIHAVTIGETFSCGEWMIEILGPIKDYEDLNDQSIVLRAEFDRISILLKGDQEEAAEREMVEKYGDLLKSTVYLVGHHGSRGSSCDELLDKVCPDIAVISCGVDNSYGHPHKETLQKLKERNILYYRTDLDGTVSFVTDGKTIEMQEVA